MKFESQMPALEQEWTAVADQYEEHWNFPNFIGSMDGKHIMIKQPRNNGFYFFNYKGNFRIVLLALVDENYIFIYVNVGYNTRISDGGVLWASSLSDALNKDILRIPAPKSPSDYDTALLYVIAADDAFPLQGNMMKPYQNRGLSKEKHIFNY